MPLLPYDYLHLVNCPEVVIISDILCTIVSNSCSNAPWSGVEEEWCDPRLGVGDVQRQQELLEGVAEGGLDGEEPLAPLVRHVVSLQGCQMFGTINQIDPDLIPWQGTQRLNNFRVRTETPRETKYTAILYNAWRFQKSDLSAKSDDVQILL